MREGGKEGGREGGRGGEGVGGAGLPLLIVWCDVKVPCGTTDPATVTRAMHTALESARACVLPNDARE